jgi:DNA polymerase III subunit delta'
VPLRDIVGHRRASSLLARAIARDTLPPALLFAGPAGIGKRRTALALAQAINCLNPRSSERLERDACGECAACRRIERGVHPDVVTVVPRESGSIRIEDVRGVIDGAGFRPFEARRRIVIVDQAEAMTTDAQDAFLKTLEEPPSASVFVLVSSMPDALLPTVRSRCSRLRFGPLAPADVAGALIAQHGYAEKEARAAAAGAEGSIGLALAQRSVDLAAAREKAQWVLEQAARTGDPSRRIGVARELAPKKSTPPVEREQLASCLRALSSLLRDLGVLATRADPRVLANADLHDELGRLSASFDSDRSMRAFAAVGQAIAALERNASPKTVADWVVLQL